MKTHAEGRIFAGSILDEQIATETDATQRGVAKYRRLEAESIKRGEGSSLKPAERMLLHWTRPLVHEIKREQRKFRRNTGGGRLPSYAPTFLAVRADKIAVATIREVLSACMKEPDGITFVRITYAIGRAICAEANYSLIRTSKEGKISDLDKQYRRLNAVGVNNYAKKTLGDNYWSKIVCIKMGAWLFWALKLNASAVSYNDPFVSAFLRSQIAMGPAIVSMHEKVHKIIEDGHLLREIMRPTYLPMLVEPYPWSKDCEGGYARVRTPFISHPSETQKQALKDADLSQVFECLNALNSTRFRVNELVLDQVEQVWASGGDRLKIPRATPHPKPPIPADIDTNDKAKKAWKIEAAKNWSLNKQLKGERVSFSERLSAAAEFAPREVIYFPHQLDFRGRAYPIPAHFNHQGDDPNRGMLELADTVPAGERGLWWLKVHLAGCFGLDKVSFEQRVQWADSKQHNWEDAKKPWQALATLRAIEDPDAAAHAFVASDGTCNGMQHYAALSRDSLGAASVNMTESDDPHALYAEIADAVRPRVRSDAAREVEEAVWLDGMIDSEVVKHPVMTAVYGVTPVGARKQIQGEIRERGMDSDRQYKSAKYLTPIVREAISEVCVGARGIMDWLRVCAGMISGGPMAQVVQWTTPLGLPVVQPYRKEATRQIKTVSQTVRVVKDEKTLPPRKGGQCDGVAPNFIHSIDATHMFMVARECKKAKIAFVEVHDAFWTHAASVDELAVIIREQFVALHEIPILDNLRAEWVERYPYADLPPVPERGDFDITEVLRSPYFFS